MPELKWYDDRSILAQFAEVIYASDQVDSMEDMFYYLHKPWLYNDEYESWVDFGSPMPNDKKWDDYCDSLDAENE